LLPLDRVLERPFEDVDDLLAARVLVPDRRCFGADRDDVLDHFAARSTDVVLLEIDPVDSRRLLLNGPFGLLPASASAPTRRPPAPRPRRAQALPKRRSGRPCRPR